MNKQHEPIIDKITQLATGANKGEGMSEKNLESETLMPQGQDANETGFTNLEELARETIKALRWHPDLKSQEQYCDKGNYNAILLALEDAFARGTAVAAPPAHTGSDSKDLRDTEARELLRTWMMHYAGRLKTDDPRLLEETRQFLAQRVPLISSDATKTTDSPNPKSESAPAASPWIREDTERLLKPITDWWEKHAPSTEESFYQVDRVSEALPELGIACMSVLKSLAAARGLPIPAQPSPWIRTTERKPTKEDGAFIIVIYEDSGQPHLSRPLHVECRPELYSFWMPIPLLPAAQK